MVQEKRDRESWRIQVETVGIFALGMTHIDRNVMRDISGDATFSLEEDKNRNHGLFWQHKNHN